MANKKSNTLAEKLILFAVFLVFAGIIVTFAFSWSYIGEDDTESGETVSLQYITESKVQNPSPNENTSYSSGDTEQTKGKVNINTATVDELDALPGIGPAKAQAIVDYRNTQGAFLKIEDVMNVSGIGEKIFEQIKDSITVG